MMSKEEYLEKLNQAFGDFKFFPEDHHYEYKGERIGISVTRFIEEFCNEFDAELIATRVAEKQGKSVQEILDEWEYKNKFACEKGSAVHNYVQVNWIDNEMLIPLRFLENKNEYEILMKCYNQANKFINDYKDRLENVGYEFVIGSEEYSIASAIDHIFINKLTDGLVLVDYKTNTDIHKNEKYAKNMKVPLQHLKDTTLNHYAIQLSIYKYLVEKYTNLKVSEWFIVWFSENNENYEIISVPYLENEVQEILERREWGL